MRPEGIRQEGDVLGDYRLARAVSEGQSTRTWEAEQLSMQRLVMVEMLRGQVLSEAGVRDSFLSDVRAKALVSHPGVGAVYEAVTNDDAAFFSRERLDGDSLESLYQAGTRFAPVEIVTLLGQISEAMLHLENEEVATVDYELHHFMISGKDQARVMNLAVEGQRDVQVDTRTKQLLGGVFDSMIRPGLPGATRVKSLCGFMTDAARPVPLTWRQISDLCGQVRDQLQSGKAVEPPVAEPSSYRVKEPIKIPASFWALIGGVALIGGLILFMVFSGEKKRPKAAAPVVEKEAYIEVAAGRYRVAGEREVLIREGFSMSRTEVTLAEYHDFLSLSNHDKFRHSDQPTSKTSHQPDHWEELWSIAVNGGMWRGRQISIECPVVGVDWWDAFAFSKWKEGRLPTLDEWAVASGYEGLPPEVASWSAVNEETKDVTGAGFERMAGSVREWTLEAEVNGADPLAPKAYVVAGASFEDPSGGISARLWVDSRSARRGDLGFRVIVEK